jgi:hypothetical protein
VNDNFFFFFFVSCFFIFGLVIIQVETCHPPLNDIFLFFWPLLVLVQVETIIQLLCNYKIRKEWLIVVVYWPNKLISLMPIS